MRQVRRRRLRIGSYLEVVEREGGALVAAVRADLQAPVGCYDGWTVADLARHVGQVHRWVTGVVADRATERTAMPTHEVAEAGLADWLADSVAGLVAALTAADPDAQVWTISRTLRTNDFWRRRMALETTLHRWDAQDAQGKADAVADWLAREGVDETLRMYMAERLEGRDVGGAGERVGVDADGQGWTVRLHADGLEIGEGIGSPDAVIAGSPLDLWLLLCGRSHLDRLEVRGDQDAAALVVRAAAMVSGPAG